MPFCAVIQKEKENDKPPEIGRKRKLKTGNPTRRECLPEALERSYQVAGNSRPLCAGRRGGALLLRRSARMSGGCGGLFLLIGIPAERGRIGRGDLCREEFPLEKIVTEWLQS